MVAIREGITLEEFLELPERKPALEFEDGQVTQPAMPKARHGRLQLGLGKLFDRLGEPGQRYLPFTETRATFGGHSYVPDVVVYRWERVQREPDGQLAEDFTTPPDVAVEIVSPQQQVTPLVRRCIWYVENGVSAALLVDPADRSVLLFRPGQPTSALRGQTAIDLAEVLPGFRSTVAEVFGALYVG